ncbi:DUF6636 domain-containing protein [Pseudoruegeria sp. HB172150]|uniref:DUF6636 domain-containing protein n=1 Tax=Pseudoruegeria sp. HB172150 TaxID=2721164 RepID=UPI001554D518|nr:DUF6636 domain-containing protein [Pseudoruegeria sp. HB172150]
MRWIALLVALTASPAMADVFSFETPSGNIECSVGIGRNSADIICEIIQKNGPPARPWPADCAQVWGHRFMLRERGPVEMQCAPPPKNLSYSDKAPYGVTGEFGGITCLSERTGFQCSNLDGHGFFLSRARQSVY